MPLNAANTVLPRRTGKWLIVVTALGVFCSCAAQKTVQQPKPSAIRDFSRFFGLEAAATNEDTDIDTASDEGSAEDEGFVEPLDFAALLGGQDGGTTHGFLRKPALQRPFGAQSNKFASGLEPVSEKQVAFPFGNDPLPLFGGSNGGDEGFRPQDFIKSKRGAANHQKSFVFFDHGQNAPLKVPAHVQRQPARKANQQAEDNFEEEEGFDNTETEDEPLFVNEEESAEEIRAKAAAPVKRRAKENRYPKYSSYYHATPAGQAQETKQVDEEVDDDENPFGSTEDDDLPGKGEESLEDEEQVPIRTQQYPTKYGAAYTAPKNARPVASNTNKQRAAYNDDPFFDDPQDFPVIQIPGGNARGKSGALQREPATGYVDRAVRPVQYGNFEHGGRTPFKPSPPDPLYGKSVSSIPSYNFDHSPSAEYREAHLNPQRVTYARSASLTAPTEGRRSASNKKANCKKVEKQISKDDGRFRRDAMTCFVCDDPNSGGTYEQCAYGSEPKTQAYYVGRSQQFRSADKEKPFTYRQRRFLKYSPYPSLPAAGSAPVKESGALKRKTRQEHDDGFTDGGFSYDPEGVLDDREDYRFGPEYFTHDGEVETGESAQLKATESSKADTPENCQKTVKENMVCMVCKDAKSGGNYEQCSYASEPKKSSYSYGKSKTYGTPKKSYAERHRRYIAKGNGASKTPKEKFGGQKEKAAPSPKRKRNDEGEEEGSSGGVEDDLPKDVAENSEPITGEVEVSENVPRKEDPEFDFDDFDVKKPEGDGKAAATEQKTPKDSQGKQSKYDDYFSFMFPEYSKTREKVKKAEDKEDPFDNDDEDHYPAESKDLTTDFLVPDFFSSVEPNKKDLEKMLGEFTQKDRSECKKVMKDQMTCFQCVDAKGMQNEECMFVAASEPKTSQLAYLESKEFKMVDPKKKEVTTKTPGNDSITSSTVDSVKASSEATTSKPAIRSRGSKKHESVTTTPTPAPSTTTSTEKKGRKRDTKANQALTRRTRGVRQDRPKKRAAQKAEQREEQSADPELEVEEEVPETEDVEAGSASVAATAAEELSNGEIPAEFKVPVGPEGKYSEDTKPVFDKHFQLTLPKYMLSKSENEQTFDEVLTSGS